MKKNLYLLFFGLFVCGSLFAQSPEERQKIVEQSDQETLSKLISQFEEQFKKDQEKALEYAKSNNLGVFIQNKDGSFDQLIKIGPNNQPMYYSLHNMDAAVSTRANQLHTGGNLGLSIEGQGMTAYVWDGGPVLTSHNEFTMGASRAQVGDGAVIINGNSFHATHVSGTISASGVNPAAKGMAPQSLVVTNDWTNDNAEMAIAASEGALLSNHSYGFRAQGLDDAIFGKYIAEARETDQIAYAAPYYLPVFSAGNDGNDSSSNGTPLGGNASYDKLTGNSVAKNVMVVANAQDAVINADGSLNSVAINSGSSQGPTDDLRIKPDIAGNGTQLLSTFDDAPNSYGSISGTSMSSPNVAGSMLLLQQYYNQRNGEFMKAATLKGVTLHSADDAGAVGPDPVWGWGLMNTMAAAEIIGTDKLSSYIIEENLSPGETYTFTVESDNLNDLVASLSWTDVPGPSNNGAANDPSTALVNDLDLRISQGGTTFLPWKLTGVTTNGLGDNTVDNYERVRANSASGTYTITVTHKGTLTNGSQDFSLIVTGVDNVFALNSSSPDLEACNNSSLVYPIEFLSTPSFAQTATLSLSNVPAGINATLGSSSFSAGGTTTLTVDNLAGTSDGVYNITVNATTPSITRTLNLTLRILSANFSPVNLLFPGDTQDMVSTSVRLDWADEMNAQEYEIQVAVNPSFGRALLSEVITRSEFQIPGGTLFPSSTYYWRVKPINACGQGTFVTRSFTTFDCQDIPANLPAPIPIPDNDANGISSVLTINEPNNIFIGKVSVFVRSNHPYSGDLLLALISPTGTVVQLTAPAACDLDDLLVTFDDNGGPFACDPSTGLSGYTGVIAPVGNLSDFNGENINGDWTLFVSDRGPADLGTLNDWSLNFCEQPATASESSVEIEDFAIYPNPSNGFFNVSGTFNNSEEPVQLRILDLNGREVYTEAFDTASGRFNQEVRAEGLSSGLYLLSISQGTQRTVQKIVIE